MTLGVTLGGDTWGWVLVSIPVIVYILLFCTCAIFTVRIYTKIFRMHQNPQEPGINGAPNSGTKTIRTHFKNYNISEMRLNGMRPNEQRLYGQRLKGRG